MIVNIEPILEFKEIVPLLTECGLSVADISSSQPLHFFGMYSESSLVAVVGLELFGTVALLRSLAVSPAYRGQKLARELVTYAESFAASRGVDSLFLLTTTASTFFGKLGFVPALRSAAPPEIQTTAQFSILCPASSAFLCKTVAGLTLRSSGSTVSIPRACAARAVDCLPLVKARSPLLLR